jgi:hypothetical protein
MTTDLGSSVFADRPWCHETRAGRASIHVALPVGGEESPAAAPSACTYWVIGTLAVLELGRGSRRRSSPRRLPYVLAVKATDQSLAPADLRAALATFSRHVHDYAARARLPRRRLKLDTDVKNPVTKDR